MIFVYESTSFSHVRNRLSIRSRLLDVKEIVQTFVLLMVTYRHIDPSHFTVRKMRLSRRNPLRNAMKN